MSFLKKLFGSKKPSPKPEKKAPDFNSKSSSKPQQEHKHVYNEQPLEAIQEVSGKCLGILEAFMQSQEIPYVNNPVIHPVTLDIALQSKKEMFKFFDSQGFDSTMTTLSFTYILSEYFVKYLDFALYKDDQPQDPNLTFVLFHKRNRDLVIYPLVEIIRALHEDLVLNNIANSARQELGDDVQNHYTYGENSEEAIEKELEKEDKKAILIEVKTNQTSDEEANRHNVLLMANIQNEDLKEKINKHYRCFSLPDIDTSLKCTMQLVRKDIYKKMDKSYTGEVVMKHILDSF